VIKTLGFYPDGNDYLSNLDDLEGPGIFHDNGTEGSEHDYDTSIDFSNISQVQFDNIIEDLITLSHANYDLNDFNCTTVGHFIASDNLGFTLVPTLSLYRWFVITGPTPVFGLSPGQYGMDINDQELEAAPNVFITSGNNPNKLNARTSTSNCN